MLFVDFTRGHQFFCFRQYAVGNMIIQYRFFTQFKFSNLSWCKSRSMVDTSYCNSLEISTFVNPFDFSSRTIFLRYWILSRIGMRLVLRLNLYSKFNFLPPGIYILGISHGAQKNFLLLYAEFLREILLQLLATEILFCVFDKLLVS